MINLMNILIAAFISLLLFFSFGGFTAAEEKRATPVMGLDGGDHEPYLPSDVKQVQQVLEAKAESAD